MAWEAQQKARLLPVPYHMVTFTIPSEFRELFRSNQKLCYTLFFQESAGALSDLAADPKHLGGAIGMTGMLQTWTRDLRYHPHIHYLVPAGALTETGCARPKYPEVLVPVRPLAVRMRNRFRMALKAADFKLYLTKLQKPEVCCGHCGCAMRFLYTLRGEARAPLEDNQPLRQMTIGNRRKRHQKSECPPQAESAAVAMIKK